MGRCQVDGRAAFIRHRAMCRRIAAGWEVEPNSRCVDFFFDTRDGERVIRVSCGASFPRKRSKTSVTHTTRRSQNAPSGTHGPDESAVWRLHNLARNSALDEESV
jgi:hypothetical protein